MTQFSLNEDQIAVRDMALDFAAEKLAPHALEWDEKKHFPVDVMREAAALGMGGDLHPRGCRRLGLTRLDAALIFEALATGCPTVSAYLSIHNMATWMIDRYGSDEQRQRFMPGSAPWSDRQLLPDRAGRRLGRGGAQDQGGARRRPLRPQRRQAVHLRRRHLRHLRDHGAHRRGRPLRHLDPRDREGHARPVLRRATRRRWAGTRSRPAP